MRMEELSKLPPFRLRPWFSPRPWGSRDLSPWYDVSREQEPIGEAWLTGDQCVIDTGVLSGRTLGQAVTEAANLLGAESGRFPLLVKVLFPFDKLSVQVHPDDQKAQQLSGEPTGKTECWYVLDARPGASVALGLNPGVTAADVRRGIDDGTLEDLLRIVPLEKGDMLYVDAGTVHAIYPGAVLLETQQNSDLTYRLYDFGRGRELHLDEGLAAMRIKTAAGKVKPQTSNCNTALIESEYFRIDSFCLEGAQEAVALAEHLTARPGVPAILFVATGECSLQVEGGQFLLHQGQVAVVPQRSGNWKLQAEEACQLICMTPGRP